MKQYDGRPDTIYLAGNFIKEYKIRYMYIIDLKEWLYETI